MFQQINVIHSAFRSCFGFLVYVLCACITCMCILKSCVSSIQALATSLFIAGTGIMCSGHGRRRCWIATNHLAQLRLACSGACMGTSVDIRRCGVPPVTVVSLCSRHVTLAASLVGIIACRGLQQRH